MMNVSGGSGSHHVIISEDGVGFTIVDDHSIAVCVFLMTFKNEFRMYIHIFFGIVDTQLGR